jgi:hypothetical protein
MRRRRFLVATAALACLATLVSAAAQGASRRFRLTRVSDMKSLQSPPGPYLTGPRTCTPDLDPAILALLPPEQRTTTEILGEDFNPAKFDEISVAGDGRLLAYATSVGATGLPGAAKEIVILPLGPGEASVRVPKVASENDQPAIQVDDFGYRCVFRSSAGAGGVAPSNIQLYSLTRIGDTPTTGTVAVTEITSGAAFDPALTARTRVREVGGGIKLKERDARVAFVATADLVPGSNPSHLDQLFLWEEQGPVLRQITRHADATAHVSRPSISKSGDIVVFESTAGLVPDAVDPIDSTRVGNPDHVRQIFRWRRGLGIDQLTWSDGDCFSPRMDLAGRFVLFASRGDPMSGGNPERNLEIFSVTPGASPARRLRQLTQTAEGDSVFPRPTVRSSVFTFFSTAHPPVPDDWTKPVSDTNPRRAFGEGRHECTPQALLYDRGKVVHVHGVLDAQNALRFIQTPSKLPVLTGPPVPAPFGEKFYFATNDYHLNPPPDPGSDAPKDTTQILAFYVAMATRPGAR